MHSTNFYLPELSVQGGSSDGGIASVAGGLAGGACTFCLRVAAAFLAAALRERVRAAFCPAARLLRVVAAFFAAARRLRVCAAFCPALFGLRLIVVPFPFLGTN